jgi:hypothetical protein
MARFSVQGFFFYHLMRQGADIHRYPKALSSRSAACPVARASFNDKNAETEDWPANFALQLACDLELDTRQHYLWSARG